jgi:hypothetical protein
LEDSTPQASVDRSIADPRNARDVADGNRRAATSGPHDGLFIQDQLRGIGRFGYSVSKENFLFCVRTSSPCLAPAVSKYFVA